MPEGPRHVRGLLDTSVVVDLDEIDPDLLPDEPAICSVTLAELAAGPHATSDSAERARRQEHLQRIEAIFDPLPFDAARHVPTGGSMPPLLRSVARPGADGPSTCS